MKYLLLLPLLAACAPHIDPCYTNKENPHCVEMDRSDRASFVVHDPDRPADGGDNGSGSASSDSMSDDSNGDGSDE